MKRRTWTKEEKISILKEAEEKGVEVTLRKHGLYPATYYSWKSKARQGGQEGLLRSKRTTKDSNYIKRLEDELSLAKQLMAEKDIEIALRDELLKKKYPWARKEK
ncbi:MAG: transposase [Saprospiraceae bacterium]